MASRVLSACLVQLAAADVPLTLLTEEQYAAKGAVCLDGSAPGFYFKAADPSKSTDAQAASSWVLYFKGGGWCYDVADCAGRAKTELGTSSKFPAKFGFGGLLEETGSLSPILAGYNHAILWYCDGASFSGDSEEPVEYKGQKLYFRGKRILDAVLDVLMDEQGPYGLSRATQVLLSGGSAGGLSTFLHADYVGSRLPSSVRRYRAAPVSGFFLLHPSADGQTQYIDHMRNVFQMQNSSGGVNARCAEAGHDWRCIFANFSYAYSKTPMFLLQSALDSWQMGNILKYPGSCTKKQFASCSAQDVQRLNAYSQDLQQDLKRSRKFTGAGEGGFVESCLEHVAAQTSNFGKYELDGVKMVEAFNQWWSEDASKAAKWHLPCKLSEAVPHQCNPTCGTAAIVV